MCVNGNFSNLDDPQNTPALKAAIRRKRPFRLSLADGNKVLNRDIRPLPEYPADIMISTSVKTTIPFHLSVERLD